MYRHIIVMATLASSMGMGITGALAVQPSEIIVTVGVAERDRGLSIAPLPLSEARVEVAFSPQRILAQAEQEQANNGLSDAEQEQLANLLTQAREDIDRQDYASAITAYQQASQIDPDNARIHSGIGYLQLQQHNYQAAVAAYRQAIDIEPRNIPFRYGLAYSLVNAGELQEAAAAYRELIRMAPTESNAYLGLGSVLLQQEDFTGALAAYEQLVAISPGNASAYEAIGNLYLRQEQYREAREAFQQAIRTNPSSAVYQGIGEICVVEADQPCAYDAFSRAVELDANNARALLGLAQIYSDRGDEPRARQNFLHAAAADPTLVPAQAAVGEIHLAEEQYIQAILAYRRLVQELPDNPGARYNLALALRGQGLDVEAVTQLRIAYELYQRQENQEGASRAEQLLALWDGN